MILEALQVSDLSLNEEEDNFTSSNAVKACGAIRVPKYTAVGDQCHIGPKVQI